MYVMSYLGERSNIALSAAGATAMLLITVGLAAPMLYWRQRRIARLGLA